MEAIVEENKTQEKKNKNKKRGKTSPKIKTEYDSMNYLRPLNRFLNLGSQNKKRQGYIKTEADRQKFLKKLYNVSNPIPNYFNPERKHMRSWWPNGLYLIKKRYNYTQIGLEHYYEKNNVEQLKTIDTEKKIKKDSEYLQTFKEFETVAPGNYIITIEYCSSCEDHSGITQHGIYIKFQHSFIIYKF